MMDAELRLTSVYSQLGSAAARAKHAEHQKQVAGQLSALRESELGKSFVDGGGDFRDLVASELPRLLKDAGFDAGVYQARNDDIHGYGRYLLHSESRPGAEFCLQLFAFKPGQKTPIHDHPNECASYVAKGQLWERLYQPPTAEASSSSDTRSVVKTAKNSRTEGTFAGFGPTELDIPHSLKNTSGEMAVSVHLYRDMDGITERKQVAAKEKFERLLPQASASEPAQKKARLDAA